MLNKLYISIISTTFVAAAQAQVEPVDIDMLHQRMVDACPTQWEDVKNDIDAVTITGDVWQSDPGDRDAFIQLIQSELGTSAPGTAELNAMADDPATVAAECATQRLGFLDGLLHKLPKDVLSALTAVTGQIQISDRLTAYNHIPDVTSHYTIQPDDLASPLIVPIDISGGNISIKELDLGSMGGWVRYVIVADAGEKSTNRARVRDSDSNEIWTGFQQGDFFEAGYDGVSRKILNERTTLEVDLRLTGNDGIGAGSFEKVFDSNYSIEKNIGGFWKADHRFANFVISDPILVEVTVNWLSTTQNLAVFPRGPWSDWYVNVSRGSIDGTVPFPAHITVNPSEGFYFQAYNGQSASRSVMGHSNKDETRAFIRLVRRIR